MDPLENGNNQVDDKSKANTAPEGEGNNTAATTGTGSDDLEKRMAALEEKNRYLEEEAKKAFTARDEAKSQLRKAADEKLIEDKKFEDLYNQTKLDLEKAQEQITGLNNFKLQIDQQNLEREKLFDEKAESLPEEQREFVKGLDLTQKEQFFDKFNFNNDKKLPPINNTKGKSDDVDFMSRKIQTREELNKAAEDLAAQMEAERRGQG